MGSGSGMNIPDHISEGLATIFWVKNTYIFRCGSGMENFGSGIRVNITDPQHRILARILQTICMSLEKPY
jgi:hypothetical protein